jgi:hypothetical protein
VNYFCGGAVAFGLVVILVGILKPRDSRPTSAGTPPVSQTRIATVAQEVIYGHEMVVLRDTETNAEYLYYGGGLTRLEKKP